MATVYYRLHTKETSKVVPIYCLVSLNRTERYEVKTGFFILSKDWSTTTRMPKQNSEENKLLFSKLTQLTSFIFSKINSLDRGNDEVSKDWVIDILSEFRNDKPKNESDLLTNHIQYVIDTAHTRENQKKGLGLSEGRLKIYKTFLKTMLSFEKHLKKKIYIKEVNIKFAENFKLWLFSQQYSINYVSKNISALKAVCNDADKQGIEISPQLRNIKRISESKSPEEILYLSFEELNLIENLENLPPYLENVRNWLILGCYLGQRGGDLMTVSKDKIKEIKGIKILELKQEKTGKLIAVPLLPKALKIIESTNLHSISLQKFSDYAKEVCKRAGIDTLVPGKKINPKTQRKEKGTYPKHELISSHVCRRSFASNFYGDIPTPVLINITGHSSESMFLKYIGKTSYDNAFAMIEHFTRFEQNKKEKPVMKVLKKANK